MTTIDRLVNNFLAQKKIALVGVSDQRETGCNAAYERFASNGYKVFAVNPRISEYKDDPCYPDLKSIPEKPDAVFILAKPSVTEEIVDQAIELGVGHIWMHCVMGIKPGLAKSVTSVSQRAVGRAREHGIAVIPGTCPNQYLEADIVHRLMNRLWRALGFLKLATEE